MRRLACNASLNVRTCSAEARSRFAARPISCSRSTKERARGVVAFSSGNHAQAVAIAARELGVRAKIAMPTDAPKRKVGGDARLRRGSRFLRRLKDDREAVARRLRKKPALVLVPPFDHEWIIAGQGTAALELLEEVDDLDALVVCAAEGGCCREVVLLQKGAA